MRRVGERSEERVECLDERSCLLVNVHLHPRPRSVGFDRLPGFAGGDRSEGAFESSSVESLT